MQNGYFEKIFQNLTQFKKTNCWRNILFRSTLNHDSFISSIKNSLSANNIAWSNNIFVEIETKGVFLWSKLKSIGYVVFLWYYCKYFYAIRQSSTWLNVLDILIFTRNYLCVSILLSSTSILRQILSFTLQRNSKKVRTFQKC